jgi:hypothetical protein
MFYKIIITMKTFFYFALLSLGVSFYSCTPKTETTQTEVTTTQIDSVPVGNEENDAAIHLSKTWETTKDLMIPESVCIDTTRNIFYIANVNGSPTDKDGNGFISKMDSEGKIITLKWIEKLDAPKGMGIIGNSLFVTNITEVVEIDIEKSAIKKRYPVKGAQFLNDITVTADGVVFISDMNTNTIHKLQAGKIETVVTDAKLAGVNGLCYFDNKLFAGTNSAIVLIDVTNKTLSDYIATEGGIDGLEAIDGETFIISDWKGSIHYVNTQKEKIELSNTTADNINAADIEFDPETATIYVPTFSDNRVMAYNLTKM